MRTMMRCLTLAAAAVLLAGCGGGGSRAKTRMETLVDGALAVARKTYPKAFLFRADSVILKPPATSFAAVDGWEFTIGQDPNNLGLNTVSITYQDGAYSNPVEGDPDVGDGINKGGVRMDLDAAVARLKATGFSTEFDFVTYGRPIWQGMTEPVYIFHVPAARAYVFVNTVTGGVTTNPDHGNLGNTLISRAMSEIGHSYPVAELYTVTARVHWDGDEPYVATFDLEFNNPGSSPVTTLVAQGWGMQSDFPEPVVEQRQMTGYKPLETKFVLDPADAVAILEDAGYTDHFTTTGFVEPAGSLQPLFFFTFPDRKVTVHVGGIDGVVSTKPL